MSSPESDVTTARDADEVTVREARIEDLAAIVDLLADAPGSGEGGDLAPYAAVFARLTAATGEVLGVAELAGQIVGSLHLSVVPGMASRGAVRAQIEDVRTLSSLRGRGIGERLFGWAFEEAGRRGASSLTVTAADNRVDQHRFYEHLGFTRTQVGFTAALGR